MKNIDNIPTKQEVTQALYSLWLAESGSEEYDSAFEYTGKESQFNNGYDALYLGRLEKLRSIVHGK